MASVAALCLLLASAEPSVPVLCVDATDALASDIADAIRVRLEGKQLRVSTCIAAAEQPGWRVRVSAATDDVVAVTIEGEAAWSQDLDVHGLRAAEVSRLVALHVVEAVRPSVDATLARLGLDAPTPVTREAAEQGASSDVSLDVAAGPVLGLDPLGGAAQGRLGAVWRNDLIRFSGAVALRSVSGKERLGVQVSGGELHVELGARRSWQLFELGGHLRGRAARLGVTSDNPQVQDGARTYWDYGVGVSAFAWPWRGERLSLGFIVQTTVWARPHLVSVQGERLLQQARVDVFSGPVLEIHL